MDLKYELTTRWKPYKGIEYRFILSGTTNELRRFLEKMRDMQASQNISNDAMPLPFTAILYDRHKFKIASFPIIGYSAGVRDGTRKLVESEGSASNINADVYSEAVDCRISTFIVD